MIPRVAVSPCRFRRKGEFRNALNAFNAFIFIAASLYHRLYQAASREREPRDEPALKP
jgi:hypothetical protein